MATVAEVGVKLTTAKSVQEANKLEQSLKKVQGASVGAAGKLQNVGKGVGGLRGIGAAAKSAVPAVGALGGAISAVLGPLAVLTTAAGALGSAFSTLATQDFAEAKVRSLGVDSEVLTKQLKAVSRELAGQADVVELTSAAYDVASAGFTDAADAANILKAASLGATGGFSDINTVGDAATSVLNAYGLEADKAGKLVDGFIQTQNDGKIVIGEYAANIAKVAPVAAALGVPLEEVNAAVAQITAGGQGAEVTFTALKTALAQVAAGKVGEEFKALGIEINASTLKSDGLAGTLEKIKKSGADAGTVIKAFGTEAGPSILALLNDTEKYNKLLENQKNAQGAAAKAAFEASNTINGALKRLQTAFTNLFVDGSELGVLLKGIFQVAAVTVEVFAAAVKMILAPLRGIGQAAAEFFKELLPFDDNINLAYELEKGFQAVMQGVEFATAVVTGFFKTVASGAYDAIGNVLSFANSIKDGVVSVFANLGAIIHEKLTSLYNALPEPLRTLVDMAAGAANAVGSFASDAVTNAAGAISGGLNTLAQVGGFVGDQPGNQSSSGTSPAASTIQKTNTQLGGKANKSLTEAEKERLRVLEEVEKIEASALKTQKQKAKAYEDQYQSIDDQRIILEATLRGNVEEAKNSILKRDLLKEHGVEQGNILYNAELFNQELERQVDLHVEAQKALETQGEKMDKLYEGIGQSIQTGIVDALTAAVEGTKSLADVASQVLRQVASILLQFGVNTALGGIPGLSAFFPQRAAGGPVTGGKPYMVGEKGPELFVPNSSGNIVPNNKLGGGANVVVNVDAKGTSASGDSGAAKQLGGLIGAAVQSELIKQQRPGGLLAR